MIMRTYEPMKMLLLVDLPILPLKLSDELMSCSSVVHHNTGMLGVAYRPSCFEVAHARKSIKASVVDILNLKLKLSNHGSTNPKMS